MIDKLWNLYIKLDSDYERSRSDKKNLQHQHHVQMLTSDVSGPDLMCAFHSYSESSLEKLAKQGEYGDLKLLLPGLPIFNDSHFQVISVIGG